MKDIMNGAFLEKAKIFRKIGRGYCEGSIGQIDNSELEGERYQASKKTHMDAFRVMYTDLKRPCGEKKGEVAAECLRCNHKVK